MSPLKESFGEEWVDMDEEEETTTQGKGGALLVEAKMDREGGYETSRKDIDAKGECMPASIDLSQALTGSGFKSKEENSIHFQSKKEKLLVEVEFEISASTCESKGNVLEEDVLEVKGEQCLKDSNEIYLELQCLKHEYMQDNIPPKKEPCIGGASGQEGRRAPMMRRVMSEASFLRFGQVMVRKSEVIHSVTSKREYSKTYKEGAREETEIREYRENDDGNSIVKVVLNKEGSVERSDNMQQNGSEELVGAHQALLMVCETPLDTIHTCHSLTSKEVCVHQTALKSVCTPPKLSKHSSIHPMSERFESLEEILMHSEVFEAAQVHSKVTSASFETQTYSKAKEADNGQVKALETGAAGGCQTKYLRGLPMEPNESEAHTKMRKAGGRRPTTLEVAHMREKSPQRDQGEGVGKQVNGGHLEVKEVECECCLMREECSIGYIEHVKAMFSGHWVCGLCAEAVHEERHRLGKGVPMEEAVRTHMHLCKQFSSKKKVAESPHGIGVAHAVCHLLSRHLSSPTSPRNVGSPVRPVLTRTSSCLPSFSVRNNPYTT